MKFCYTKMGLQFESRVRGFDVFGKQNKEGKGKTAVFPSPALQFQNQPLIS